MKYLFIDSATANLVVAIIIDNKIKYLFNDNTGQDTSSVIMPKIEAKISIALFNIRYVFILLFSRTFILIFMFAFSPLII